MERSGHAKFDHEQHARSKSEDDFWGQIRRTVNGTPVDEAQILMIVDAIRCALRPSCHDVLLDLACGNGALASRLFGDLAGYLGVDFSPTLIGVARKYFERPPEFRFSIDGASEYVRGEAAPERFTKALCYGSFSYFSRPHADDVLGQLNRRFVNVERVFIGNLPDRARAEAFYGTGRVDPSETTDHESSIGIWRTAEAFVELARSHGWQASISRMPEHYYAAHYRYDVLLTR